MHIVPAPRDSAEFPVRVISRVQLVARVTGGGVVAVVSWYIERNSLSVSPRGILKSAAAAASAALIFELFLDRLSARSDGGKELSEVRCN